MTTQMQDILTFEIVKYMGWRDLRAICETNSEVNKGAAAVRVRKAIEFFRSHKKFRMRLVNAPPTTYGSQAAAREHILRNEYCRMCDDHRILWIPLDHDPHVITVVALPIARGSTEPVYVQPIGTRTPTKINKIVHVAPSDPTVEPWFCKRQPVNLSHLPKLIGPRSAKSRRLYGPNQY